jgi:uncharacterized membrane protein
MDGFIIMGPQPSNWHIKHKNDRSFGQIAADVMRNGMGSWLFVGSFITFMVLWAFFAHWDPFPFIFLNLLLSMLAGMQGAILLIASKRQDQLASAMAQHDYDTNLAAKKEIEDLTILVQDMKTLLERK